MQEYTGGFDWKLQGYKGMDNTIDQNYGMGLYRTCLVV